MIPIETFVLKLVDDLFVSALQVLLDKICNVLLILNSIGILVFNNFEILHSIYLSFLYNISKTINKNFSNTCMNKGYPKKFNTNYRIKLKKEKEKKDNLIMKK